MNEIIVLFLILAAILATASVTWLLLTRNLTQKLKSLSDEISVRQTEIVLLKQKSEDLAQSNERLGHELESLRTILLEKTAEAAALRSEKDGLIRESAERQKQLDSMQQKVQEQFEAISVRVLQNNSRFFSEQSQQQMTAVLNPLKEKLDGFEKKVQESVVQSESGLKVLQQQIKDLGEWNRKISSDAENLTQALKGDKKLQGNWGELQLEMILSKAGLEKGIHFDTQVSLTADSGDRQQPDVIVYLPDEKHLIIDSKVSIVAYTAYYQAESDEEKARYLKDHTTAIRNHIRLLSDKKYERLNGLNTPDYVLMFIPLEPAFSMALQADPELFTTALERNIVLVTTSTLLATLRTVSSIWKQENQKRNVLEIADEAGKLYDKFSGFMDDMKKIGDQMGTVQKTYDGAMNKLSNGTGNILSRFEKMKKLGARATKSIDKTLLHSASLTDEESSDDAG